MAVVHVGLETIFAFAIYSRTHNQVLLETITTNHEQAEAVANRLRLTGGEYSVISLVVQEGGGFY